MQQAHKPSQRRAARRQAEAEAETDTANGQADNGQAASGDQPEAKPWDDPHETKEEHAQRIRRGAPWPGYDHDTQQAIAAQLGLPPPATARPSTAKP